LISNCVSVKLWYNFLIPKIKPDLASKKYVNQVENYFPNTLCYITWQPKTLLYLIKKNKINHFIRVIFRHSVWNACVCVFLSFKRKKTILFCVWVSGVQMTDWKEWMALHRFLLHFRGTKRGYVSFPFSHLLWLKTL
jgi:hypothetical protein